MKSESENRIYVYPELGLFDFRYFRVAGPGLGNILLTWARALIKSRTEGWPLVAPAWLNIKPGALFRRENDPRSYHDLFDNSAAGYITGLTRAKILFTGNFVDERLSDLHGARRFTVVSFKGIDGLFSPLIPHRKMIVDELFRITRANHLPAKSTEHFIGLHIRCGDFAIASSVDLTNGAANKRVPVEWFAEKALAVRNAIGAVPIKIFSDGNADELRSVLKIDGAELVKGTSALQEMLMLAQSSVLIGSGSTFSLWAAFIGAMPSIWYPKQCHADFSQMQGFSGAWESGPDATLSAEVVSSIKQKVSK